MSLERSRDLAQLCTELVRNGNDFPTVWSTVLKSNALVDDVPQQRLDGNRSLLEIRLISGERLVFEGDAKKFQYQIGFTRRRDGNLPRSSFNTEAL
jgi:hypothetical protein